MEVGIVMIMSASLSGIHLSAPWLTVDLGQPHDIAGWPVVGPAFGVAKSVTWLQVEDADLPCSVDPDAFFLQRARQDGVPAEVGLLTAADVSRFAFRHQAMKGGRASAVVTAGLGNGESVMPLEEEAVENPRYRVGTVNILAVSPQTLASQALLEMISIVAEARTAAILDLGLRTGDGRPVTGTGTDCIIVAAPIGGPVQAHCGLHTDLGKALGEIVYGATSEACVRWLEESTA